MLGARETTEVCPDRGHANCGRAPADPRYPIEQADCLLLVAQVVLDFRTDSLQRLLKRVAVAQLLRQQEGVGGSEPADDGLSQQVALGTQTASCQLRKEGRIGLPGAERFKNRPG